MKASARFSSQRIIAVRTNSRTILLTTTTAKEGTPVNTMSTRRQRMEVQKNEITLLLMHLQLMRLQLTQLQFTQLQLTPRRSLQVALKPSLQHLGTITVGRLNHIAQVFLVQRASNTVPYYHKSPTTF